MVHNKLLIFKLTYCGLFYTIQYSMDKQRQAASHLPYVNQIKQQATCLMLTRYISKLIHLS